MVPPLDVSTDLLQQALVLSQQTQKSPVARTWSPFLEPTAKVPQEACFPFLLLRNPSLEKADCRLMFDSSHIWPILDPFSQTNASLQSHFSEFYLFNSYSSLKVTLPPTSFRDFSDPYWLFLTLNSGNTICTDGWIQDSVYKDLTSLQIPLGGHLVTRDSLPSTHLCLDHFRLLDIMWANDFLNFTSCTCYNVSFLMIHLISVRLTHTESLGTLPTPNFQFILKSWVFFSMMLLSTCSFCLFLKLPF